MRFFRQQYQTMAPTIATPTTEPTAIPAIMPVLDFFFPPVVAVPSELKLLPEPELELPEPELEPDDPAPAVLTGWLYPVGLPPPAKFVKRSIYEERILEYTPP